MKHIFLLGALLTMTGCAGAGLHVPEGSQLEEDLLRVGRADVAWSGDAERLVVGGEDPFVFEVASGRKISLGRSPVNRVAFSPAGDVVAAVVYGDDGEHIAIFNVNGQQKATQPMSGRTTGLAWKDDNSVVWSSMELEKFGFGGNLKTWLSVWSIKETTVKSTLIADNTLNTRLTEGIDLAIANGLDNLAVGPYRDECMISHYVDPPLFPPYINVTVRRFSDTSNHLSVKADFDSSRVFPGTDGDSIWIKRDQELRRFDRWSGKELQSMLLDGNNFAVAPGSGLVWDGRNLHRGEQVIGPIVADRLLFSPDGAKAAVVKSGMLSILNGLASAAPFSAAFDVEKMVKLRSWRAQKLISHEEYLELKRKLLKP